MHHFTVDQAGKIEQTSHDTILSLTSHDYHFTIKIPKQLKQNFYSRCNPHNKKKLTLRLFSYGLFLLLDGRIDQHSIITIDDEYPGHSRDIKQIIISYLDVNKDCIRFSVLGRQDISHIIANSTFSGKLKPNLVISERTFSAERIFSLKELKNILK